MTLTLSYRWEHALIAATIEAAKRNCSNRQIGRTAVQKLLYFLNVMGVPMSYDFDIHHYGPFCADIMHDVDWLLLDGVIQDQSSEPERCSDYTPGGQWTELKSEFADKLSKHQATIDEVCGALSDLSPGTLELIATLDFCYRWVRAKGDDHFRKEDVVQKFKAIKEDKFSDDDIDQWYNVLVECGLFSS